MKDKIIAHIKQNGPLSVDGYMAMCLYDPQQGYYNKKPPFGKAPFGKDGDFITAPELTPLFGEMLGLWVADVWAQMGQPTSFNLIELGPGSGVLAADMLHALEKAAPACLAACRLHLVEISPALQAVQEKNLKHAPCPVKWHERINTTPQENAVAIGNELLDALPVKQYAKKADGHYYERLVTQKQGELAFTLAPTPAAMAPQSTRPIIEQSPAMNTLLQDLKKHLQHGVVLLLDYGSNSAFFKENAGQNNVGKDNADQDNARNGEGDTLQAVQNHQYTCIFAAPGEADLTWHISFQDVAAIMGREKCAVTDMGLFLTELGLPVRAEQAHRAANATANGTATQAHIEATTQRLLDPNQMGRHFKVLCWQGRTDIAPAGFLHLKNNNPEQQKKEK